MPAFVEGARVNLRLRGLPRRVRLSVRHAARLERGRRHLHASPADMTAGGDHASPTAPIALPEHTVFRLRSPTRGIPAGIRGPASADMVWVTFAMVGPDVASPSPRRAKAARRSKSRTATRELPSGA